MYSRPETSDMSVVTAKLKWGSGVGEGEGLSVDVAEGRGVKVNAGCWVKVGAIMASSEGFAAEHAPRRITNKMLIPIKRFIIVNCNCI